MTSRPICFASPLLTLLEWRSVRLGGVDKPAGDLATVRTRFCSHGSKSKPKSPNPANHFEKTDFRKKCQSWTALPDTESPPKYFILGNLGNPDSLPMATCPASLKLPRRGYLGTIGEGHFVSTPARPVIDRPLLTMISIFENIVSFYSGY